MTEQGETLDDDKPSADVEEQQRPETEEPTDPEATVSGGEERDGVEADAADVADQRREIPLDEDDPRD